MPFCSNCGAAVDGQFCAKCGTKMGDASPPDASAPRLASSRAPGLTSNLASAICYIVPVIGGIIFLVLEPYNRDRKVKFDAFQSIFLGLALLIISYILRAALGFSYTFGGAVMSLYSLACVVLWVYLALKAYQQHTTVLPVIGPIAERQANG